MVEKVSRKNLVQNSRTKFYDNLNKLYVENATAPILPPPQVKKPAPIAPAVVKTASAARSFSSKKQQEPTSKSNEEPIV